MHFSSVSGEGWWLDAEDTEKEPEWLRQGGSRAGKTGRICRCQVVGPGTISQAVGTNTQPDRMSGYPGEVRAKPGTKDERE